MGCVHRVPDVSESVANTPLPLRGHARPLSILLARLVKLRPVYATMLTHDAFFERVKTEISRCFEPGEKEYADRIRVISLGPALFLRSEESDANFKAAWEKLVAGEPVTCQKTQTLHSPWPKPQAITIDLFAVDPFQSIKAVSGNTVKVYTWHCALTYEMFHFWAPEKLGGRGNLRLKAEEEARRTGRPYLEVAGEMSWGGRGELVQIPAFPPMYDYEYFPQDFPMSLEFVAQIFPRVHETLEASDGVFLFTAESFEPEAVAAVKAWYGETSRPAYLCGPLLPDSSQAATNEKKLAQGAEEIEALLETTLKTSGERSLIYISFGSVFWPVKTPEKMWAVLDVIMELNIPFILSHASPLAVVPDDVREKVKAYGKGIISAWTPQQLILDHPATGWFIAHGGHNGVMEAVSAGVPQILWPFIADQPLNAIHMSEKLQIAYELIEVRSGGGLKPIYRNGRTPKGTIEALKEEVRDVLLKAFGEDGAKKRERLLALREQVIHEWEEGGASLRDVTAFLDSL
ncbi:UDP-Glycosyltransferase/glycogen phosphorylase [Trametes cingulata]|nr:UDP-Glycosyltransferase/glycogen phosphorylase [Trametes cingulata]